MEICKAADAGNRLIVVIAGIRNNLRNPTQARIDEGIVGGDTWRQTHAKRAQQPKAMGVGRFGDSTSTSVYDQQDAAMGPASHTVRYGLQDQGQAVAVLISYPKGGLRDATVYRIG